jgi:nucleoside phosphorylase
MTEQEEHSTQTNRCEEAWHRGETIHYDATSGSIIQVPDGRVIQARDLSWSESQKSSSNANSVLLVTVNTIETKAVLDAVKKYGMQYGTQHDGNLTYYDLGKLGGVRLFLVRSGMGSVGPDAAAVTISEAIARLKPSAIVATGIAFGVDRRKQEIGEILISEQMSLYEPQRASTTPDGKLQRIPRGDRVHASPRLLNRFKDGEIHWRNGPKLTFGLILSGDMLVDNLDERNALIQREPEAIGGEMEAAGLYSAAGREKVDWIVVKAICDWADGKKAKNKESNQERAAKNAAEFLLFVIRQGGLADRPDTFKGSPATPPAGFTNWIDISDQIVNPGFEDGFGGWEEDSSVINSEQAASRSVDDTTAAHSGTHSRKLFLREGGSYIKQIVKLKNPLSAHCQIRLGVYVRMPFRGGSANKWFTLMLITYGGSSDQVDYAQTEQFDTSVEWTKVTAQTEQLNYPIHKLEIHAFTTKGGGAHKGFDKPVWVDDFNLEYRSLEL